jgi:transposase
VKIYRPYSPDQSFLLPPSPREWLPEGHLAYFVLDLLEELDLGEIERAIQRKDPRGERPFSPRMMTALLLYGYAVGVFSSRKIEKATFDDVAFRVLAAGEHPHFTSINEFRARHREALGKLFDQLLQECMSAGLVKLGHVAIDGTKMKANASKHKAMSYERMNKDEKRLKAEIEAYFDLAEKIDAEEDAIYGVGQQAHDLPAELRRREDRIAKIREVRAALKKETTKARAAELERQADELRRLAADANTPPKTQAEFTTLAAQRDQQSAEIHDDDDDVPPPSPDDDLPRNTPPKHRDGTPKPKAQRNFTDPDSRIMMRDGAFVQAYNAQIAVDEEHQIIVAAGTEQPVAGRGVFRANASSRRRELQCRARTCDRRRWLFLRRQRASRQGTRCRTFHRPGPPRPRQLAERAARLWYQTDERQRMRALLSTERGKAAYARRKSTVEPVFGQIRTRGVRQMSFRGLVKNRLEWLLICAPHNLLKLWRSRRLLAAPTAA